MSDDWPIQLTIWFVEWAERAAEERREEFNFTSSSLLGHSLGTPVSVQVLDECLPDLGIQQTVDLYAAIATDQGHFLPWEGEGRWVYTDPNKVAIRTARKQGTTPWKRRNAAAGVQHKKETMQQRLTAIRDRLAKDRPRRRAVQAMEDGSESLISLGLIRQWIYSLPDYDRLDRQARNRRY